LVARGALEDVVKTYKGLYRQVYAFENLYIAFRRARRGKRDRPAVAAFEFDLERNLLRLQEEVRAQTYRPGAYTNFYIREPKRRLVSAAPFRDRVVHHALCRQAARIEIRPGRPAAGRRPAPTRTQREPG